MALFLLVTPQSFWADVTPIGFTSNTRNMTLPGHPGITFLSSPGITPTAVEMALGEPTNVELTGIYQTGSFEQYDVLAGKWSFAEIEVFSACWNNVNLGELVHFRGNLGEFKDFQQSFTAEGRGLLSRLSNDVSKATSRLCRVKVFRDAECGHTASTVTIDSVAYDIEAVVTPDGSFDATDTFIIILGTGLDHPENFFANGLLTINDGNNAGISREIAYSAAGDGTNIQLQLKRPFPYAIAGSEDCLITGGCNRTLEDCIKYENVINRRAEDWVPGIESANRIPPGA
jgi:uncharacterized phage protein (TIGR02218 family)